MNFLVMAISGMLASYGAAQINQLPDTVLKQAITFFFIFYFIFTTLDFLQRRFFNSPHSPAR